VDALWINGTWADLGGLHLGRNARLAPGFELLLDRGTTFTAITMSASMRRTVSAGTGSTMPPSM
jgi:hypothetical protein